MTGLVNSLNLWFLVDILAYINGIDSTESVLNFTLF